MAHLIGYVGEVNGDMLNQERFAFYNAGDIVGQSGVEAQYNDLLMGKNGSRRVLVNSKGKEVGELSDTPAVPGQAVAVWQRFEAQYLPAPQTGVLYSLAGLQAPAMRQEPSKHSHAPTAQPGVLSQLALVVQCAS